MVKKKIMYAVSAIVAIPLLWFAYYTISPFFIHIKLDEALPQAQQSVSETAQEPQVEAVAFPVVGTTGHPASGTVRIVEVDSKKYVRYENFKTINGPDIYVYLAKDLGAQEYVDLGRVKATEGNVNYEVPGDVTVSDYRYVMVWCKAFGVLFNYADLTTIQ